MTQASPHAAHEADDQADFLDLEADVFGEYIASITAWLPIETSPRHIVDLGCGTGAGTFPLLTRFPGAEVTAVDSSPGHLRRLREKAEGSGTADRIRTVQADLDADWPDLGTPELVWASASMHHMTDPDRTLRQIHETLAPSGLFALVELAGFPRFIPEGAPEDRPGLEERCHAALAKHVPHRGADWPPKLTAAGFKIEAERTITVNLRAPHPAAVGRYAYTSLARLRGSVAGALRPEDLTALDRLLDCDSPHSILRRGDLTVHTERTAWAARRP